MATTDYDLKYKVSRMFELCQQLWPREFKGKYTVSREKFRDWMNEKTGLNVDHTKDKRAAIEAWLEQMEILSRK